MSLRPRGQCSAPNQRNLDQSIPTACSHYLAGPDQGAMSVGVGVASRANP